MVDFFTLAGLTELLVQVITSLIIGVVIMIPIMFIFFAVNNIIIKKKIPKDLLGKGGIKQDAVHKKETTDTRTITDQQLRTYAERKYRFGNHPEQQDSSTRRGIENSVFGEKLENIQHPVNGETKRISVRNWK